MIRFASLGSGSKGNCLVVESGGSCLLLDFGFSVRETTRRLARLGRTPDRITAILVTHEHDDHVGHAFAAAAAWSVPLWCTYGTLRAVEAAGRRLPSVDVNLLHGRERVAIGDLEVLPFTVPHDAREPVQYLFSDGANRVGVLTDIGTPTPHVVDMLSGCDALVLECNHDAQMLRESDYPRWLRERISGPLGHLENADAAALLAALDRTRLKHLVAAHLSERNNRPDLACAALAGAVNCTPDWIGIARQEVGFDWRELR